MEFFVAPLSREESDAFVDRTEAGFAEHGSGVWAVEEINTGEFIGQSPVGRRRSGRSRCQETVRGVVRGREANSATPTSSLPVRVRPAGWSAPPDVVRASLSWGRVRSRVEPSR